MQDAISDALSKAYGLIEEDKLDEARAILEPLTTSQSDNPDVWWVYAHAVSDPETARKALQTVLRLDPAYPEAADLMKSLDAQYPPPAAATPARPAIKKLTGAPPAAPPPDLPEKGETLTVGEPGPGRRTMLIAGVGLVIIAIIAAVVTIVLPPKTRGQATATAPVTQEAGATVAAVATAEAASTGEVADYTPIRNALSAFNVQRIQVGQTGLGDTLLVSVCTTAGSELRKTLPEVMDVVARQSQLVKDQVAAVGARMVDCTTHSTLSVIAVTIQDAINYASGSMAEGDFQAAWKPQ